MMEKIVNDFTINIATANGTGSQSANLILLNSLFRMGTHASGKNLFPSSEKDFCLFWFLEKNSSRVFMLFLWASSLLQLFVLVGFTLGNFISLSYYINSIQSSASFIGCIFSIYASFSLSLIGFASGSFCLNGSTCLPFFQNLYSMKTIIMLEIS